MDQDLNIARGKESLADGLDEASLQLIRERLGREPRGLRAVADFEYEYQMVGMNRQLDDTIETVFLMADVSLQPIASKLVKEIALFGGDIAPFVSKAVREDVLAKVAEKGQLGDY